MKCDTIIWHFRYAAAAVFSFSILNYVLCFPHLYLAVLVCTYKLSSKYSESKDLSRPFLQTGSMQNFEQTEFFTTFVPIMAITPTLNFSGQMNALVRSLVARLNGKYKSSPNLANMYLRMCCTCCSLLLHKRFPSCFDMLSYLTQSLCIYLH